VDIKDLLYKAIQEAAQKAIADGVFFLDELPPIIRGAAAKRIW
jgi:hypothetical protein